MQYPHSLPTNAELSKVYHLDLIINSRETVEQTYDFLRLRNTLAEMYNDNLISDSLRSTWCQNILILTGSVVEVIIQYSLLKVQKRLLRNNYIYKQEVQNSEKLKKLKVFSTKLSDLIDLADNLEMLMIHKDDISKLRILRNNIHISNDSGKGHRFKLSTSTVNWALEIFDHVLVSIFKYHDLIK